MNEPTEWFGLEWEQIVRIWERWTDGNPALRRCVECRSADPASHEEQIRRLLETTATIRGRSTEISAKAALAAARVLILHHAGADKAQIIVARQEMEDADRHALQERSSRTRG